MDKTIQAVVLDFGGVMTTTTMPERVRPLVQRLGIPWDLLEEGFARYRRLMDGGFIDLATLYSLIWADAGLTVSAADQAEILKADTASFLYRNERTLAWMKELKSRGLKLGILTNMPPSFAGEFRRVFADFIALADEMVISGEVRMFKPQRQIYDLLRMRLGLPAEALLFVDDSEPNCVGARAAGWQAIRFESNEQIESAVDSCRIMV